MQGAVLPPPPRCLQAQKHQHINNKGEALAVIVPSMQERESAGACQCLQRRCEGSFGWDGWRVALVVNGGNGDEKGYERLCWRGVVVVAMMR